MKMITLEIPDELAAMCQGYMAAMVFTDEPDEPNSDIPGGGPPELSSEAKMRAYADCISFYYAHSAYVAQALERRGYSASWLGHDFWLTRNGHGAGFWDREELKHGWLGNSLTGCAEAYKTVELYVSDDGELEVA